MSIQAFGIPTGIRLTTRMGQLLRSARNLGRPSEGRQLTIDALDGVEPIRKQPVPVYRTAKRTSAGLLELAGVRVYPFQSRPRLEEHAREQSLLVVLGWDE